MSVIKDFYAERDRRLEIGAREYGNQSFRKPRKTLAKEIQEEAADLSGWGWVFLKRFSGVRDRALVGAINVLAIAAWTLARRLEE